MFTVDDLQAMGLEQELLAGYYRVLATKSGMDTFANIAMNHKKLADHYYRVAQRVLDRQQMEGVMKRWKLYGMVLVVMMLLLVGSVGAQDVTGEAIPVVATVNGEPVDATVEPTPALDPAAATTWQIVRETLREYLPSLGNIVLAFVVAMAIICVTAIFVAGNGMPKWARPIAESGKSALYSVGDAAVSTTPLTFDDAFWAQMKKLIDEKWATIPDSPIPQLTPDQIRELRQRVVPVPLDAEGG